MGRLVSNGCILQAPFHVSETIATRILEELHTKVSKKC